MKLTNYFFRYEAIFHLQAIFQESHSQGAEVVQAGLSHCSVGLSWAAGQREAVV